MAHCEDITVNEKNTSSEAGTAPDTATVDDEASAKNKQLHLQQEISTQYNDQLSIEAKIKEVDDSDDDDDDDIVAALAMSVAASEKETSNKARIKARVEVAKEVARRVDDDMAAALAMSLAASEEDTNGGETKGGGKGGVKRLTLSPPLSFPSHFGFPLLPSSGSFLGCPDPPDFFMSHPLPGTLFVDSSNSDLDFYKSLGIPPLVEETQGETKGGSSHVPSVRSIKISNHPIKPSTSLLYKLRAGGWWRVDNSWIAEKYNNWRTEEMKEKQKQNDRVAE